MVASIGNLTVAHVLGHDVVTVLLQLHHLRSQPRDTHVKGLHGRQRPFSQSVKDSSELGTLPAGCRSFGDSAVPPAAMMSARK